MKKSCVVRWLQFSGVMSVCLGMHAEATEVALAGVFPGKALMVINGAAPRTAAVGTTTPEGVRIHAVDAESATVDFDGRRHRLFVGQQALNVSGRGDAGSSRTVSIHADSGGQFNTTGSINGASMRFIVDTGATFVSIGRSDAQKAGIDITKGEPVMMQTANGIVRASKVRLDAVRVGDVTLHSIEGIVHGTDMPIALLGMSFLNRMEMRRDGTVLQLRQRY
jgi:aspartyl protease family protein